MFERARRKICAIPIAHGIAKSEAERDRLSTQLNLIELGQRYEYKASLA